MNGYLFKEGDIAIVVKNVCGGNLHIGEMVCILGDLITDKNIDNILYKVKYFNSKLNDSNEVNNTYFGYELNLIPLSSPKIKDIVCI